MNDTTGKKLNLEVHGGYIYSTQESSDFLRESFDPRQVNFLLSSLTASSSTLEFSSSGSEEELVEAIGKKEFFVHTFRYLQQIRRVILSNCWGEKPFDFKP